MRRDKHKAANQADMLKEGVRSLQPGRIGHRPKIVGDDHGDSRENAQTAYDQPR
jgi:hypothetical protein